MHVRSLLLTTPLLALLTTLAAAQTVVLHTSGGRTAESVTPREPIAATQTATVEVPIHLTVADGRQRGEVWLEVSADATGGTPTHITLRMPLSNTGDVYGESRSCSVKADGSVALAFSIGLEEANYVRFAPAEKTQAMKLLLNKVLCRALAAPFQCNGQAVSAPDDWSQWHLGATSRVLLTSDAPASLSTGAARVQTSGQSFDPASCRVIAPSNGLCCVSGKTTEWHCGGSPVGEGWHQVSGECFHRETGGRCGKGTSLELPR